MRREMKSCQQRESELLFQSNVIRMEGGKKPNNSKQTANDMEIPFYDYGWTFQAFQDSVLRHRSCRSRQKSCASFFFTLPWKRRTCFCTSACLKKEKLKLLTLLSIAPRKHDYQIMIRVVKHQKLFFPKARQHDEDYCFIFHFNFPKSFHSPWHQVGSPSSNTAWAAVPCHEALQTETFT